MAGNLSRFKPGAPRTVHLLVAAIVWTAVGLLLMIRGGFWLCSVGRSWLLIPSLLLGTIKSLLILDKTARKSIDRIVRFQDGRCLGSVYSIKTWVLVLLMMSGGCLLRNSSLPRELLGLLYVTVGWGLFFSSRHAWLIWKRGPDQFPEVGSGDHRG